MAGVFAVFCIAVVVAVVVLLLVYRYLPAGLFRAEITARSNHTHHVRQAGGLAVGPVVILLPVALPLLGIDHIAVPGIVVAAAALFMLGVVDDLGEVPVPAKLAVQLGAAGVALVALAGWPSDPLMALGTVLAVVLLAYWVNVANFMDGMDLMEVVGLGLPVLYLSVALLRVAPESAVGWTGVALCGALTGFAGFNWPPARLFLGDSGSLVSGLVSGLVVFETAGRIGLPAALLPVLYFAVDASSTLVWRARRGENLFAAHSSHAYQIARRAGAMPGVVVLRVGVLGVVLCALSYAATLGPAWLGWLWLALGLVLTGLVTLRLRVAPAGNAGQ